MEFPSRFRKALSQLKNRRDEDMELRIREAGLAFALLRGPTPNDFTEYWRERFYVLSRAVPGLTLEVPECDRSYDQIQELAVEGRTLVVNLPELTLEVLGLIHPEYRGFSDFVTSEHHHYGWLDVAANVTDVSAELMEELKHRARPTHITTTDGLSLPNIGGEKIQRSERMADGRFPMTFETYLIAASSTFAQNLPRPNAQLRLVSALAGSTQTAFGKTKLMYAGFDTKGKLITGVPGDIYKSTLVLSRLEGVR